MTTYTIKYELNGQQHHTNIEASNPGHAFRKCENLYPGCRLLGGFIETWHPTLRRYFSLHYDPPSQIRVVAEKEPQMVQEELAI